MVMEQVLAPWYLFWDGFDRLLVESPLSIAIIILGLMAFSFLLGCHRGFRDRDFVKDIVESECSDWVKLSAIKGLMSVNEEETNG